LQHKIDLWTVQITEFNSFKKAHLDLQQKHEKSELEVIDLKSKLKISEDKHIQLKYTNDSLETHKTEEIKVTSQRFLNEISQLKLKTIELEAKNSVLLENFQETNSGKCELDIN